MAKNKNKEKPKAQNKGQSSDMQNVSDNNNRAQGQKGQDAKKNAGKEFTN